MLGQAAEACKSAKEHCLEPRTFQWMMHSNSQKREQPDVEATTPRIPEPTQPRAMLAMGLKVSMKRETFYLLKKHFPKL